MAHISGKLGAVYGTNLLIEDCEDVWVAGDGASSISVVAGKVGTYAVRDTTTALGAAALMMTEIIAPGTLAAYDGIYFWARSSVNAAAADFALLLDDTALCATPIEILSLPSLSAAVWKQCFVRLATPAADTAIISIGMRQVTDLADLTFDIDDVEALAEVDGIKSWTMDYTADLLETTDFADDGTKSYLTGSTNWQGSFEGYKEGAPLAIGSEIVLVLGESATASQNWLGRAVITGAHPNVSVEGLVTYSYDYFGVGALQSPDA